MARLPIPGSDDGQWGQVLNDFLTQSHKNDGSLKNNIVTSSQLAPNAVNSQALAGTSTDGQVLTADSSKQSGLSWSTPTSSGSVPDASAGQKGIVQLIGDLGGTATAPTVAKLQGVTISGTPSNGQVLKATSATAASWQADATGGGGSSLNVVARTSGYTAANHDYVIGDATSAGFTVTLPAATNGAQVSVKKIDSTVNAILVQPQGGVLIDASPTVSVNSQWMAADFVSDGTKWFRAG